nr:reverse transcriptase-like protein [Serratia marcescens]
MKEYLLNPPVLAAPVKGKPMIVYTAATETSLGALLAQHNEESKEQALYYLRRTLIGAESRYSPIERFCLALVFVLKKLRHYLLSQSIHLISRIDVLKYILVRTAWAGRLAKWALVLLEFHITYIPQTAIKGQIIADFLAAHPIPEDSPLAINLPGEDIMFSEIQDLCWTMFFDGASSVSPKTATCPEQSLAGAGIVFETPDGRIFHFSFSLDMQLTNNEAEYEALIAGLLMAKEAEITKIRVYGDSQLIVRQVNGVYEVRKEELKEYCSKAQELMGYFEFVQIEHISRSKNHKADALSKLAAALTLPEEGALKVIVVHRSLLPKMVPYLNETNFVEANRTPPNDTEETDWRTDITNFLKN